MDIDMVLNIHRLHQYQISPQEVFDAVERAGGVYEANLSKALQRTFNPFFWIGRIFESIASIPFKFFSRLGLNGRKMESSFLGKVFKGVVELFGGVATICGTLKIFGWLDPVLEFLKLKP